MDDVFQYVKEKTFFISEGGTLELEPKDYEEYKRIMTAKNPATCYDPWDFELYHNNVLITKKGASNG